MDKKPARLHGNRGFVNHPFYFKYGRDLPLGLSKTGTSLSGVVNRVGRSRLYLNGILLTWVPYPASDPMPHFRHRHVPLPAALADCKCCEDSRGLRLDLD